MLKRFDPIVRRRRNLLYRYGLEWEQYERILIEQENACYICKKLFTDVPNVDHDHETGRIRGLLCWSCNTKLGWFERRKEIILAYIEPA